MSGVDDFNTPSTAFITEIKEPFVLIPLGDPKSKNGVRKIDREARSAKEVKGVKGAESVFLRFTRKKGLYKSGNFTFGYAVVTESAMLGALNNIPKLALPKIDITYEHLYMITDFMNIIETQQQESVLYKLSIAKAEEEAAEEAAEAAKKGAVAKAAGGSERPVSDAAWISILMAAGAVAATLLSC